jgi:hypothetical protein
MSMRQRQIALVTAATAAAVVVAAPPAAADTQVQPNPVPRGSGFTVTTTDCTGTGQATVTSQGVVDMFTLTMSTTQRQWSGSGRVLSTAASGRQELRIVCPDNSQFSVFLTVSPTNTTSPTVAATRSPSPATTGAAQGGLGGSLKNGPDAVDVAAGVALLGMAGGIWVVMRRRARGGRGGRG